MKRRKIILESPHGCRLGECNYAVGQEINYSGLVDQNKKRNQMQRQMIPFFLLYDSTYQKR